LAQCSVSFPHHPKLLQQAPYVPTAGPVHVLLLTTPHRPSTLAPTAPGASLRHGPLTQTCAPQCSSSAPHRPYTEQHGPHSRSPQIRLPKAGPHVPSLLTFSYGTLQSPVTQNPAPQYLSVFPQYQLVEQHGPSMLPLQVPLPPGDLGPHTGRLGGGGAAVIWTTVGSTSASTVNVHDRFDFMVPVFEVGLC